MRTISMGEAKIVSSAKKEHTYSVAHGLVKYINEHCVPSDEGEYRFLHMSNLLEELRVGDEPLKEVAEEVEKNPRNYGIVVGGVEAVGMKSEGGAEIRQIELLRQAEKGMPEKPDFAVGHVLRKEKEDEAERRADGCRNVTQKLLCREHNQHGAAEEAHYTEVDRRRRHEDHGNNGYSDTYKGKKKPPLYGAVFTVYPHEPRHDDEGKADGALPHVYHGA